MAVRMWGNALPTKPKTRLFKSTLIRRLGVALTAQFEGVLAEDTPYVRMLFNASEWFGMDDAMVAYMHSVLAFELGPALGDPPEGPFAQGSNRADELLEPDH